MFAVKPCKTLVPVAPMLCSELLSFRMRLAIDRGQVVGVGAAGGGQPLGKSTPATVQVSG